MTLTLHTITHPTHRKPRVRRGRGDASAGSYSGRGMKGQKARSGTSGFKERSLRRFIQQIPKTRGFKSITPKPTIVTLGIINSVFNDGAHITPRSLKAHGLLSAAHIPVKILNKGELSKKYSFADCRFSAGARSVVLAKGGTIA